MSQRGKSVGWDVHRHFTAPELCYWAGQRARNEAWELQKILTACWDSASPGARQKGRRDNSSHIKWKREETYRSGGAWGDVEERHPILGALRNGEVFWYCVKRLQMNQHLICLVDAEREEVVSHNRPHSSPGYPSQPSACTQHSLRTGSPPTPTELFSAMLRFSVWLQKAH